MLEFLHCFSGLISLDSIAWQHNLGQKKQLNLPPKQRRDKAAMKFARKLIFCCFCSWRIATPMGGIKQRHLWSKRVLSSAFLFITAFSPLKKGFEREGLLHLCIHLLLISCTPETLFSVKFIFVKSFLGGPTEIIKARLLSRAKVRLYDFRKKSWELKENTDCVENTKESCFPWMSWYANVEMFPWSRERNFSSAKVSTATNSREERKLPR